MNQINECHDNDSPWLVCKACAKAGCCKNELSALRADRDAMRKLLEDAVAIIEDDWPKTAASFRAALKGGMMEDYDDLGWHALNYRTAASQHAEAMWQELSACVERRVAAAIAEEREACAALCEERRDDAEGSPDEWRTGFATAAADCAVSIRARSAPRTQEG